MPIGARRTALGVFAVGAFLIAVGNGVTYGASGLAWLMAVMTAPLACLGVLRVGSPRWLYISRPRYGVPFHGWIRASSWRSLDSVRYRFSTRSSRMPGRSRGGLSSLEC